MPDYGPFPDPEACLLDLLADLVTDTDDIGTVIPIDLQARLAGGRHVIRLYRVGGEDDRITDRPRVVIEVFASTIAVAKVVAEQIRQRLISRPHATAAGVIDRARTDTGPAEWPYEDQDVRRIRAYYRLSLRRRTIA